jgi:hypothetical protein
LTSEIVREGWAAWCRLRQERAELGDWKALGAALLEGRAIAMHNAGTSHPIGHGYVQALNSWLLDNRLSLSSREAVHSDGNPAGH